MKTWKNIKGVTTVIWRSLKDFMGDKVLRMSAALAYYTIFSLAPILILVISILDKFYKREAIEGQIYGQISSFVGHDAALQIQQIIANTAVDDKSSFAAIFSIIVLVFSATSVFGEIQDSINQIWRIKAKPRKGWLKMIVNRLLSFSILISIGFLLLVSLLLNAIIDAISGRLSMMLPQLSVVFIYIVNLLLVFGITTLLFAIIFKVLPDAKIKWKHVIAGAITTSTLFMLGKGAISFYIGRSDINSTYGAAGSIVIVLLWVYYSSTILYFGAEFTRNYSEWKEDRIHPNDYAVWIETVEVETKQKLKELPEEEAAAKAATAIKEKAVEEKQKEVKTDAE
jgi:membrane protein